MTLQWTLCQHSTIRASSTPHLAVTNVSLLPGRARSSAATYHVRAMIPPQLLLLVSSFSDNLHCLLLFPHQGGCCRLELAATALKCDKKCSRSTGTLSRSPMERSSNSDSNAERLEPINPRPQSPLSEIGVSGGDMYLHHFFVHPRSFI